MPRANKGGKREGAAQTAYANRTDLNNRGPQPITAAPGEPYGQRKMLEDAQRAVPMGGTPIEQHIALNPTPPVPPAATIAEQPAKQLSAPEPGQIPFLHPTQRPNEDVTAGAHADNAAPMQRHSISTLLETAAASDQGTPLVAALAEFARLMDL